MRSRRLGPVLAAALSLTAVAARAAETPLELAVKATYLYKVAPFVTWPSSALGPGQPLTICVQGSDPFGSLIDRAAAGQRVGGRPVVVRRVARLQGAECQVAYLAGSSAQTPAQALEAVAGQPVLTVTDAAHGGARGVIHLVLDAGRVRFSIDLALAAQNGLAVSSKLLALATDVKR